MAPVEAWLQVAVLAMAATIYFAVAGILARRPPARDLRPGFDAFRLWWGALATALGILTAFLASARSGRVPLAIEMALLEGFVLANSLAAAALLGHVVFVWTGSERLTRAMWVFLVASAFAYTTLLFALDVQDIRVVADDLVVEMGAQLPAGSLTIMMGMFFLPHVLGALCHLGLMLRAPDVGTRDRAGLLAGSILLSGFSPAFVMLADEMGRSDLTLLVYGVILLAPVVAFLAYSPPEWMRRRWAGEA